MNKVYYDISKSPYVYTVKFSNYKLELYFSSTYYQEKFEREITEFIEKETDLLSNRLGGKLTGDMFNIILYIKLYKRIEKRGYRVYINGDDISPNYYISFNIN